ncbi:putative uncharacterized protein DDB_G0287265, partial [Rhagoletis pomonella]|uniref:putative uncharacterized protein DDB_G0287265 n=1 Tax=Rhagoletis pomonella TaxID=28610 RepID=UPI00177B079B
MFLIVHTFICPSAGVKHLATSTCDSAIKAKQKLDCGIISTEYRSTNNAGSRSGPILVDMSSKFAYFLAALLAILCLAQHFEDTSAVKVRRIQRVLTRDEIAARRETQHNTNNRLSYTKQGGNNDDDDDDNDNDNDDDDDNHHEVDGTDEANEDSYNNPQVLRDDVAENAAVEVDQNSTEGAESEEARARRRRRRRG